MGEILSQEDIDEMLAGMNAGESADGAPTDDEGSPKEIEYSGKVFRKPLKREGERFKDIYTSPVVKAGDKQLVKPFEQLERTIQKHIRDKKGNIIATKIFGEDGNIKKCHIFYKDNNNIKAIQTYDKNGNIREVSTFDKNKEKIGTYCLNDKGGIDRAYLY